MILRRLSEIMKKNASGIVEAELGELENIFAMLLFGGVAGVPLAPSALSLELLPYLGHELEVMSDRTFDLDDMLCRIASMMSI